MDSKFPAAKPTPIEQTIGGIWMELLELSDIGLQSNFFSLGGNSMLAIQSLSKLREHLPVVLSLSDFFENATVAQQAVLIRKRLLPDVPPGFQATADWEQKVLKQIGVLPVSDVIPSRDRSKPSPLSPDQERIWFLEKLNSGVPVYNESGAVRLKGRLNVEVLQKALDIIVDRREVLRSMIQVIVEQPVMVADASWRLVLKRISLLELQPEECEAELARLLVKEPQRPFLLETEPGIRATLIQVGPQDHVFILMMHHIICDWSSEGVIWRELSEVYRALLKGESVVLPPLTIQHEDYASWQKGRMEAGSFKEDLAYWKKQLLAVPSLLELPSDRKRPGVNSYRGARKRFPIGSSLVHLLRKFSRDEEVTLFTVFTAALDVLLHRYTGGEDICLGIPFGDRDRPEIQNVVGFLLHTHVLRTRLSGKMSFRELLAVVQKGVSKLYTHRSPPFDQVVSEVHPERYLSYSPLFQVMINWLNPEQQLSFIGLEGLKVASLLSETRTAKFDLTFMLADDADEISLEVEYSTELFDEERIDRMVGHYRTLLEGIVTNPQQALAALPMLTDFERRQILEAGTHTEQAYPSDRCLHELIEAQSERTPDAIAVVCLSEQLTYRQLNERANQLAHRLRGLGVGPDTLVGICMERSLEMVVGLLGILKAGGAYVPMDPEYPRDRLAFMLEDADVPVLLTQTRLAGLLPPHQAKMIQLDAEWPVISCENPTRVPNLARSHHLAYMIYTSGSTGKPKGAMNTHKGIVNRLLWMQDAYQLAASDRVLQKTPFSFDVSVWEFFWPLLAGARLVMASPGSHRDAAYLANIIAEEGITTLHFVPSMLSAFLEQEELASFCTSLKRVICSGEALPYELQQRFFSLLPSELHNLYGPTEAAVDVTYWACDRASKLRIVPIGRPIANIKIYILDLFLQPVPLGVPGELHIGGIGLARGYHNRPELTAEKFISDPLGSQPGDRLYKTGDLARFLSDGSIEYLGRLDHQVKIRGFRIELGEIEAQLTQHPSVREALAVAREDSPGDKFLAAYLISKNGELADASELREFLLSKLPDYMVPSVFVKVEQFPLTPNGKVDRKALPKPEFKSSAVEFLSPKSSAENALARIWCDVLGIKQIGVRESFFEIGGHSLLAMRLASRIKRDLNFDLPVRAIFQHPTIESLALQISIRQVSGRKSELIHLQSGGPGPDLIFLVDEGSLGLFKLAYLLDKNLPLYVSVSPLPESALKASAENRLGDLPSMESLAADHVRLIQTRQSGRPIILVGHCFGGELAFEVARQLQKAGEQIETILMLDSWMAQPGRWWIKKTWLQAHFKKLWQQGPSYFWRKTRRRIYLKRDDLAKKLKLMTDGDYDVHVPWFVIRRIYRRAAAGYRREVLPRRGILFLSQDDWESNAYRKIDNTLGTGRWFGGGVEVIDVPGDHVTVLDEMHSPQLALAFNAVLSRIYEATKSEVEAAAVNVK